MRTNPIASAQGTASSLPLPSRTPETTETCQSTNIVASRATIRSRPWCAARGTRPIAPSVVESSCTSNSASPPPPRLGAGPGRPSRSVTLAPAPSAAAEAAVARECARSTDPAPAGSAPPGATAPRTSPPLPIQTLQRPHLLSVAQARPPGPPRSGLGPDSSPPEPLRPRIQSILPRFISFPRQAFLTTRKSERISSLTGRAPH